MPKFSHSLSGILLIIFFNLTIVQAQQFGISDRAEISLITGSPGADLYTLFGHSAIRVYDPATGFDILYNYGTFDFDTEGFYFKFVQRRLKYFLSISDFQRFVNFYSRNNRSIYEQKLNLSPEQVRSIYAFLQKNYLPENRFYLYDFFYDNCSSRIRDVFKDVLKDDIKFEYKGEDKKRTYRSLIDPYQHNPWVQFGLYLILGSPTDKVANPYNYMFLPDYLMAAFDEAEIKQADKFIPLVSEKKDIITAIVNRPKPGIFTPNLVFWGLLIIVVVSSYLEYKKKSHFKTLDFILFLLLGLIGLFFLVLWLGTDHEQLSWNFNLLWALPTHLFFAFLIWKKNKPSFVKNYFLFVALLAGLTVLAWFILPQQLHTALLPLFLIIILRSLKIAVYSN